MTEIPVKKTIGIQIPVVYDKRRCFEAGADYFLSKTEDFEEINIVISELENSEKKG